MNKATPSTESIRLYYNERVDGKLRDFTNPNPRIEAAIELIAGWAPSSPQRVLEIGCGVGHTTWRMARAWPQAEVIGSDISPLSIEVAKTCFELPNLTYRAGPLAEAVIEDDFDLVVMTDVYEHIAPADRPDLHAAIRRLMSPDARFILTAPTPALQQDGRCNSPAAMQPVDEEITLADLARLATDVEAKLVYYREVGIWKYADYFHVVLARFSQLADVALRQPAPGGMRSAINRVLGLAADAPGALRDYLGSDLVSGSPNTAALRFDVKIAERRRLAARWLRLGDNR